MLEKIEFPEGVTYVANLTVGDLLGSTYAPPMTDYLYRNSSNYIINVKFDTSNATSAQGMFQDCTSLRCVVGELDTSNMTNISYMFYGCSNLTSIPQLDTSNVTNISYMFKNCDKLISIPDFNCVKVTNFGSSSSYSWLYGCSSLQSIGVIDCDSVTNIGYVLGNNARTYLTHLGGFRNLGKASSVSNTNGSYFMAYAPNLTYESVLNVLNGLYDRASAGLSVLTLKLHANHLAMLSEDDIAIATNKGWTIV